MKKENKLDSLKEKNLAYGGQALIEGVLMRGQDSYAFTVKKPDGTFYKEKTNYLSIGKRIKLFAMPFFRGTVGLFENLILGLKVLNKSAEVAMPEEEQESISTLGMVLMFGVTMLLALVIFTGIPYFLASLAQLSHNNNPVLYNLVAGLIRMAMFFLYLFAISFMNDTKRVFAYHGAEHKTINTYESKAELTTENVKKHSRLHPRCGTSFVFIVFLITLFVFPLFNIFFNSQAWYTGLENYAKLGHILQKLIHIGSHIFIGMPIVAAISYELLKISQKFQKNPLMKLFIAPGLFFQLFSTKEPDDEMIKAAILSLKMVLGEEAPETARNINDKI